LQGDKVELDIALKESEENYTNLSDDYNTLAQTKDSLNE
jgi:hypothetical protein